MDIRLRSLADQTVQLDGLDLTVEFAAGEEMRTEISTKFTRERLEAVYAEAGLEMRGWFTDAGRRLRAQPRRRPASIRRWRALRAPARRSARRACRAS